MISLILIYFLLALASICNAVMDKCSHHFNKSIFSNFKNQKWWNGEISWKNKYIDGDSSKGRVKWILGINKPVQITDAWHFFKMLMIIFICSALTLSFTSKLKLSYLQVITIFISLCTTWNTVFSLFYKIILSKRNIK